LPSIRFTVALLVLCPGAALAQSDAHDCNASPDFASAYNSTRGSANRAQALRDALATHPDSLFLNRWLISATYAKPGAFEAEYKKRLDEHPGEPLYLFLYAESLTGKDTPRAIELLEAAIKKDPRLVQGYAALADLYYSQNFRDPEKLGAALRSYFAQCPGEGGPYNLLTRVEDPAVLRELAPLWRKSIEGHPTPPVVRNYSGLWSVEMRAAGRLLTSEFQEQVRKDMERIRQVDPQNTDQSRSLIQGYWILGDEESAMALEAKALESKAKATTFAAARLAWQRAHPEVSVNAGSREYLEASGEWVKRFPDETGAWDERLTALARTESADKAELEKAGDGLIAANGRKAERWSYQPVSLRVAQVWLASDIRLGDCARLAAQAGDELNKIPATGDDRVGAVPDTENRAESRLSFARTQAFSSEIAAYRKLREFDAAQKALAQMKTWLDTNPADAASARNVFHLASAELAEARGDKATALDAYGHMWRTDSIKDHALALWRELGRTPGEFDAWWSSSAASPRRD
jgi:hypothetical protein